MPTIAQHLARRPKPEQSLQEHVNWYVKDGYRVVSQTATSAQLVKPKRFSFAWALLWLLVFYLIYYAAKSDKQVYLLVKDGLVMGQ